MRFSALYLALMNPKVLLHSILLALLLSAPAAAGEQDPFKGTPSFNLHFAIRPEASGRR